MRPLPYLSTLLRHTACTSLYPLTCACMHTALIVLPSALWLYGCSLLADVQCPFHTFLLVAAFIASPAVRAVLTSPCISRFPLACCDWIFSQFLYSDKATVVKVHSAHKRALHLVEPRTPWLHSRPPTPLWQRPVVMSSYLSHCGRNTEQLALCHVYLLNINRSAGCQYCLYCALMFAYRCGMQLQTTWLCCRDLGRQLCQLLVAVPTI